MKVIIADDSSTIRACVQDMLADLSGVDVVGEADDAPGAIQLVQDLSPDVAVLDISMPGGGGLEVLKQLQQRENPPVSIMLTNFPYPEYRQKCMEAGAEFFFDKSSEFDKVPMVLRVLAQSGDVRKFSHHVAMEQLVEMSERTQQLVDVERKHRDVEQALGRREAILFAVGHAADRFLKTEAWTTVAADVLAGLGKAAEVCCAYIVQTGDCSTDNIDDFLWVSPAARAEGRPYDNAWMQQNRMLLRGWSERLKEGEIITGLTRELTGDEHAMLSAGAVLSFVVIPVFQGDSWWGAIGFYDSRHERQWLSVETEALRTAAATLSAAIYRRETEISLRQYSEHLEEMVTARTRELRHAEDQLLQRERLAVLGKLARGVGHELRNPLSVIANAVYFLKTVLRDADAKTVEYLDMIAGEVRVAERTVSDLLLFSKTGMTDRARYEVRELVRQALAKLAPPTGVAVSTDVMPDTPPVFVDRDQVLRIITNLLANAYQCMPEGGRVDICARGVADAVLLEVRDKGCGIPRADVERIFEPLFTTKARGIGLGLALGRNLAELNGGALTVVSEEGCGSTFTVTLPVDTGEDNAVSDGET